MFFVRKRLVIMLFSFFFTYLNPPNERICTFRSNGPSPENNEHGVNQEPAERINVRFPATRRLSSSPLRLPRGSVPGQRPSVIQTFPHLQTPAFQNMMDAVNHNQSDTVSSTVVTSNNVNNQYNEMVCPTVPPSSVPPSFPYVPNPTYTSVFQPILTPHQRLIPEQNQRLGFQSETPRIMRTINVPLTRTVTNSIMVASSSVANVPSESSVDPDDARREMARERKRKERERKRQQKTDEERRQRMDEENRSRRNFRAENETEQQRQTRRAQNRTITNSARQNETPMERTSRLANDAAAHQESRANANSEETQRRLERDAAAHQESRANATSEETQRRLERDAAAHQESRTNATAEQRQSRLSGVVAAARRRRADLSPQRAREIQEADAAAHRRRYELMSTQERADHNTRRRNVYQLRMEERRNTNRYIAMGDEMPDEHYIGQLNIECIPCGALYFPGEATMGPGGDFDPCCNHGRISLGVFLDYPQILQDLMTRVHGESSNFHENIRKFNNALAMASLEAKLDAPPGRGPPVFRVHGQVMHNLSAAMPPEGRPRSFGQLYFVDTAQAVDERMGRRENSTCSRNLMQSLSSLMVQVNQLARTYKMLKEVYEEEKAKALATNSPLPFMKMMFFTDKTKDQRRYNSPTSNEVAAVYVGPDGEVPTPRDVTVFLQHGGFTKLQTKNPKLDPLTYPLFFPTGKDSWHPDMRKDPVRRQILTRMTQSDYYGYLFSIRRSFNPLHYGGKLLQQFAVDVWIRMEQNRLEWVRHNQSTLRAELFQNLEDFVQDGHGGLAGTRVILPSSHVGSARNFSKAYYDTMSMVSKYGKPDLFCTFTCNPGWREIVENLHTGQEACDRPDLVARVFVLKWKEFMQDILERRIFGQVISYAFTVEWQKRGLPHCHLLITLAAGDKPDTTEKGLIENVTKRFRFPVDRMICAEIPDRNDDPVLYEIVKTHMIHRKCGATDPTAPCRKDGKCSKHFPKKFCSETNMEGSGYPEYRRRDNGITVETGSGNNIQVYDNRHVVPYNKWVSQKYKCHVNIEVCCLLHACKYLYKYCFKGNDKASMELRNQARGSGHRPVDEITQHLDARYLYAPEAFHRIFGNKIQDRSHSIDNLQVHLPENQRVTFVPGEERDALNRASSKQTNLTAFFALNQKWHDKELRGEPLGPVDPRTLIYPQIPEFFTYKKVGDEYVWDTRGNGGNRKIGRMYGVSLKERDRFALRQLLLHRKGPRSFEDLKTINGHLFSSFEGAATALGLLNSSDSFAIAMDEACLSHMPYQLRRLFASLLLFEVPHKEKAIELWEKYAHDMSEDYERRGRTVLDSRALAWYGIEEMVGTQNLDLRDFIPPPLPQRPADTVDEAPIDYAAIGQEMRSRLNAEQERAISQILSGVRLAYIEGAGGCGKTFVYKTLYNVLRGQGKSVICAAWTGIASSLLPDGRTICSLFKLNSNDDNRTSSVKPNSRDGAMLRDTDTIIIDEVSMLSVYNLEAIDKCLKDVCNCMDSFGGKRVLIGGDFRQVHYTNDKKYRSQTLPIPAKNSGMEPFSICLKNSTLFYEFTKFELLANMRASTESQQWKDCLINVGNGTLPLDENQCVSLPREIQSGGDLISEVFNGVYDDPDHIHGRAILTCRNRRVDAINNDVLDLMEGESRIYYSFDEQQMDQNSDQLEVSTEFMNQQSPQGFPLHALRLKKGCVVMLIRNLNIRCGLCNGTRLQVTNLGRNIITANFINGPRKGEPVLIPRIEVLSNTGLSFKMKRTQFPIKLAFAMTINKSQGQSLEKVGIDLEDEVFAHGMLYVALSRSKTKSGVKVLTKENNSKARNIVDVRVLQ